MPYPSMPQYPKKSYLDEVQELMRLKKMMRALEGKPELKRALFPELETPSVPGGGRSYEPMAAGGPTGRRGSWWDELLAMLGGQ